MERQKPALPLPAEHQELDGKNLQSAADWLLNVRVSGVVVDKFGWNWIVNGMIDNEKRFGGGKIFLLVHVEQGIGGSVGESINAKVTATTDGELFFSAVSVNGDEIREEEAEKSEKKDSEFDFKNAKFIKGWIRK